jgi:hypothetical protein
MKYPLVRDLAAQGFPVRLTCGVLGVAAQPYYRWLKDPICQRDLDDAYLVNELVDLHHDDPTFGYRFLADEVKDLGHVVSETRVHKLCRTHRIWSTTTKKGRKASGKTPGPAVTDDLVQREFSAPGPNMVWLTDITEHPSLRGQALPLLDQGRVLQSNRRLLNRLEGDGRTGLRRLATGHRATTTPGHRGGSQRPRRSVQVSSLSKSIEDAPPQWLTSPEVV